MTSSKPLPPLSERGEPVRRRVIDAAERLLRDGRADFSMRDLAAAAGVSFATPFNHFGSKAAIMHALSTRRIETMMARLADVPLPQGTMERVLRAIDIAVDVMTEEPEVNRAVMAWIGTTGPAPGEAMARSSALWALALGEGEGLIAADRAEALCDLPRLLALGFRGALSFWTAGELDDEALASHAREVASALLASFVH